MIIVGLAYAEAAELRPWHVCKQWRMFVQQYIKMTKTIAFNCVGVRDICSGCIRLSDRVQFRMSLCVQNHELHFKLQSMPWKECRFSSFRIPLPPPAGKGKRRSNQFMAFDLRSSRVVLSPSTPSPGTALVPHVKLERCGRKVRIVLFGNHRGTRYEGRYYFVSDVDRLSTLICQRIPWVSDLYQDAFHGFSDTICKAVRHLLNL